MKVSYSFTFKNLPVVAAFGCVVGASLVPQVKAAEPAQPTAPAPTSPTLVPPSSLMRSGGVMRTPQAPPTAEDALNYLKLDKVKRICAQPIALKVDNASADTVAAQVRRLLATAKIPSKIPIEVRRVKSISLTFNSKKATVSKVLSSTAQLGAAKLWLFSDHLLLAPAEALTPAEKEAQEKGFAQQLETGEFAQPTSQSRKRLAYSSFIANELKDIKPSPNNAELLKSRESRSGRSIGPVLANTTFSQLSPDAQGMLQELLSMTSNGQPLSSLASNLSQVSFSGNTPVEIIGESVNNSGSHLEVFFAGANQAEWTISWGLNGSSIGIRGTMGRPNTPTQPSKPGGAPPLDLSAGKS